MDPERARDFAGALRLAWNGLTIRIEPCARLIADIKIGNTLHFIYIHNESEAYELFGIGPEEFLRKEGRLHDE